jgi:hypothetical protein
MLLHYQINKFKAPAKHCVAIGRGFLIKSESYCVPSVAVRCKSQEKVLPLGDDQDIPELF